MIREEYLDIIEDLDHRAKLEEVLEWVKREFPQVEEKIAWNQPMFSDHGTFIIGFSTSKKHLLVAPEKVVIEYFSDRIKEVGYTHTKMLLQIRWEQEVNYELLRDLIRFNIEDKKECTSFWRK